MATRSAALATGGVPEDKDTAAAKKTYAPLMEAGQVALGKIRDVEKDIAKAEGDIAKAKYEQETTKLVATQKAEEEYAGETRGLYERAETQEEKYPFPSFKPTQEDATSYAQLGSMVITLGMMLGGGAKASGKSALASMTGMVNGWREGRQDLWRRESQQFDKDMQRIKSEREAIQKNLEKGLKLAATDRKAAQASIDAAAHLAGEGVIKEMLKKGQLIPALNHMKSSAALEQKINESIIGMAAAERRNRQQLAAQEAQRQATLKAAETRAGAKGATSGIGKVAEGKIEAKASLLKQYDSLIEDYEKNKDKYQLVPEIRMVLAAIPGGAPLSEKLMSVARSNPKKLPNAAELSQFIGKLETVIAPDRHALYGANLTINELPRYERTIPKVTDDPEVFLNFLKTNRKSVEDSLRNSQEFYSRRGVDLKLNEIYDKSQPFIVTASGTPTFNTLQEAEAAKKAFGSYEPDKYDYRRDPQTGRMQRAQKE